MKRISGFLSFLVIFSATLVLSGCSSSSSNDSSDNTDATKTRMYPVALMNAFAINPATLSIKFSVTNDGSQSVSPQCKITMQDASGTYRGWDIFYLEPLAAGVTQQIVGTLTITKEGAQYANKFSGECIATTSDSLSSAGKEVVISDIENYSATDGSEGWYWMAQFKADQAPMTQMDCVVKALDKSGNVVGETAFRGNTLNGGYVTAYGPNERADVDASKSVVLSIKSFDVKCTL